MLESRVSHSTISVNDEDFFLVICHEIIGCDILAFDKRDDLVASATGENHADALKKIRGKLREHTIMGAY